MTATQLAAQGKGAAERPEMHKNMSVLMVSRCDAKENKVINHEEKNGSIGVYRIERVYDNYLTDLMKYEGKGTWIMTVLLYTVEARRIMDGPLGQDVLDELSSTIYCPKERGAGMHRK